MPTRLAGATRHAVTTLTLKCVWDHHRGQLVRTTIPYRCSFVVQMDCLCIHVCVNQACSHHSAIDLRFQIDNKFETCGPLFQVAGFSGVLQCPSAGVLCVPQSLSVRYRFDIEDDSSSTVTYDVSVHALTSPRPSYPPEGELCST